MLSQIRHFQKGLLIAVTAVIVVSFALLYSDYDFVQGTLGRQDCVVKVYDRCYRLKEARKLASHFDVAIDLGMYDFAMALFGERRRDRDTTEFMMQLLVLRHEAERLGIEPSPEEIKAAIPTLPIFQQPFVDGKYIENNVLGPNGFTQGDFAQLVKDYLSFQRLRELVGAGVEALPSEAAKRYLQENQRYSTTVVRFDRAARAAEIKPSDEEIAKYYEEKKDSLLSEPKRGFDYIKFIPQKQADDATNEVKAKANLDFANAVNRAYADLAEAADSAAFVSVTQQYAGEKAQFTAEVGKLEAFAPSAPPELIKGKEAILDGLFGSTFQVGGTSVPLETEDGAYFVFHFSDAVEPTPLSLEEATPAIREALIASQSDQAVNDAAGAALAKLNEAVKGGKTFAAAAADLGLKAETIPAFSTSEPPADLPDATTIVVAARSLGEKETSGVTQLPGGAGYLLVHVDKIEIYKDDQAESRRDALAATVKNQTDRLLFSAWLQQASAKSNAQRPDSPSVLNAQ